MTIGTFVNELVNMPGPRPQLTPADYHPRWCHVENCELCHAASGGHPDANPHCEICYGAGFVHPLEFNRPNYRKAVVCQGMNCLAKIRSGAQKQLYTFENFHNRTNPTVSEAKRAAKALTEDIPAKPFLALIGNNGCGKTHLSYAVALKIAATGRKARYFYVKDLISFLLQGLDDDNIEKRVDDLCECYALILDDFRMEYLKDWGKSEIERIINRRYELCSAGEVRVTMITSNNPLVELTKAIADRFTDGALAEVIAITATSFRPLKK